MSKMIWKSLWAVVAGFSVVVILSTLTDFLLESAHIYPQGIRLSTGMLGIALLYRMAYTVLGGYVTARLAPHNPKKHVIILGIIGTIAGIGGAIAGWNLSDHWYPIAIAITGFPCVVIGGILLKKQSGVFI